MTPDVALAPGERVLWTDHPQTWRAFLRPADLFLMGFAVFAGLFFVAGTVSSARSDGSTVIVAFFFPIIFFGLFFFVPRIIDLHRDTGATFTLTDRRIVLHSRRREVEFDLASLHHLELERSWLTGPVIFFGSRGMYEGWSGFYGGSPTPGIRGVRDPEGVYRSISEARAQALRR